MARWRIRYLVRRLTLLFYLLVIFLAASCNRLEETGAALPTMTVQAPTALPSATPSASPQPTTTPTIRPTPSLTPIPTGTPTATPIPTYTILRGEVLVRANCRYGPGAPYLYKYGLVPGSNLEIIGRNDLGTWILIQAIGGNNPCWVKASLMDVKGDVMSVAPTYIPLPPSPYYGPLRNVAAIRMGNEVTISWSAVALRAGDETAEAPYLVEAWICTGGQLIFTPVGAYTNAVTLVDEAGCSEPSHGRVFLVEKHGYTNWVEIPWPPSP